jgi:biotin operon repressor
MMNFKQTQCKVFSFLVDYIKKNKDGKYDSVMRELPEIKLSNEIPKQEIIKAIQNLVKIGYLIEQQVSRGYDIRISKLGYERWNNK